MELNGLEIKDWNIHKFDLKGNTTGKINSTCPFCSADRKPANQKIKCATAYLDTGYFSCHHCGEEGQLHSYEKKQSKKNYVKPEIKLTEQQYSDDLINYVQNHRSIKESTLKHFKIKEKGNWFSFPYLLNGEVINVKSRTIDKKFQMVKGAEKILYNLDSIGASDKAVIVEGEFDVLAFYEAGIYNVVSVPNGFNKTGIVNLSYLDDYYHYFENKEKIYIAVDNDEAGENGRKELIRRFGAERCYLVDFKDCKDANDFLIKHGGIELANTLSNAELTPLEHVQTVKDYQDDLEQFYLKGIDKGYTTGIDNLDAHYSTELGQFTVITAPPQAGKSEIVDAMCLGYSLKYGFKTAFCSPENKPNLFHSDKILRKIIGYKPTTEYQLNSDRYKQGIEYMHDNFHHVDYDDGYDLTKVLNKFQELVHRKGIRVFVLDPYNKIPFKESKSKGVNEYTLDYLNEIDMFCKKNQCILFLVAHPVKMKKEEGSQTFIMPTAYDIKGGGEFFDMSYHILAFVKDVEKELVRGRTLKVKFQHLGASEQTFWLKWNINNGRYKSIDFDPEEEMQPVTDWDNSDWLSNSETEIQPLIPEEKEDVFNHVDSLGMFEETNTTGSNLDFVNGEVDEAPF